MKKKIICEDDYEAQKLASLIYIKDDRQTFITGILEIYDNELVISLKDKSAHSILLKDRLEAESFADFIQSILDNRESLTDTQVSGNMVEITKE